MNNENLGKCNVEFEFSKEGFKTYEKYLCEKAYKCESLISEKSLT